ncbi:MAG: hypothetical protein IJ438_13225 [Clostridia bacterium]|nr:hypothetical protein [Clostridia bacterium]
MKTKNRTRKLVDAALVAAMLLANVPGLADDMLSQEPPVPALMDVLPADLMNDDAEEV